MFFYMVLLKKGDFMNLHQLKYFSDTAKSENLTKTRKNVTAPKDISVTSNKISAS